MGLDEGGKTAVGCGVMVACLPDFQMSRFGLTRAIEEGCCYSPPPNPARPQPPSNVTLEFFHSWRRSNTLTLTPPASLLPFPSPKTPTSLQWYLEVYPQLAPEHRPLEVVQQAGDTIFLPAGGQGARASMG